MVSTSDNRSTSSRARLRTIYAVRQRCRLVRCQLHTILALIFALVVYVMEVSEHLECGDVGTRVVDNSLTAVFD